VGDFRYFEKSTQKIVVEDKKSVATAKDKVYRLKKHMLLAKYPDICFREVV